MHRARAGLFIGEHACIGLVLACSSANMRASTLCWLVHRRTCMHRARAGLFIGKHACIDLVLGLFIGEHACIGLVLACSSASTRAPSRASFQEVLASHSKELPVLRRNRL